jgi:hypothetical protein
MRYRLLYTDKAVGQLGQLPERFIDPVEHELYRLSDSPASLSVPITAVSAAGAIVPLRNHRT